MFFLSQILNITYYHFISYPINFLVMFYSLSSACVLHDLLMRKEQVFGEVRDGLYLLKPSNMKLGLSSVISIPKGRNSNVVYVSVHDPIIHSIACVVPNVALWHIRLGHLPFSVMKNLDFIHFHSDSKFVCPTCPKARQHRLPFLINTIKSTCKFELIHIDTWGPFNTPTYDGFNYFLTIVDDFSSET